MVEAADAAEVDVALELGAEVVGINARDLHTFRVDPVEASRCIERIPAGRVAVYMSGVRSRSDLKAVGEGRADAVLIGEGLMRQPDPGMALKSWLQQGEGA